MTIGCARAAAFIGAAEAETTEAVDIALKYLKGKISASMHDDHLKEIIESSVGDDEEGVCSKKNLGCISASSVIFDRLGFS
jgi:hypothetical protein